MIDCVKMPIFESFYIILYCLLHSFSLVCICKMEFKPLSIIVSIQNPVFKCRLPCEQRLHFRGMSWCAKSSLCRQPFNFLSCMRKIRHAIRKQLVRQICVSFAGKLPANYSPRASVLFFCFAPSGFNYFSRKISTDRLF